MMSSTFSIPIDNRTISGATPAATSSSSFSCECVVDALWITSDFASPMLARWLNSCSALHEGGAGFASGLEPEADQASVALTGEHLVGKPVVRIVGQPRVVHPRHLLVAIEYSATLAALSQCRCMRTCKLSITCRMIHAFIGDKTAPVFRSRTVRTRVM